MFNIYVIFLTFALISILKLCVSTQKNKKEDMEKGNYKGKLEKSKN